MDFAPMDSTNHTWNFDPWSIESEEVKPMYMEGLLYMSRNL